MPKPIADHSHIDTRSHQLDTCAVAKGVRRYPLFGECRYLLCSRLNISIEFKSNARRTERLAVAIDKDWFIVCTGLPLQQCSQQIHRFGPQWTDSSFPAFPEQLNLSR